MTEDEYRAANLVELKELAASLHAYTALHGIPLSDIEDALLFGTKNGFVIYKEPAEAA